MLLALPLGEMGMGCAMDEMVLAVADMTLGSLHTVEGEATSAMMLRGWWGWELGGAACLPPAPAAPAPAGFVSSFSVVMVDLGPSRRTKSQDSGEVGPGKKVQ